MRTLSFVLIACLGLIPVTTPADDVEHEEFNDTVMEVEEQLAEQGFEKVFMLDHQGNASSVDLELRPTTVLFFTNPYLERRLLFLSHTIAIDLPLKVLVFEDAEGEVHVIYNSVGYLMDRHRIRPRNTVLGEIDKVFAELERLDNGLITKRSTRSLDDTVLALEAAIEVRGGFRIPIVFDFSTNRRGPAKLIVFGNPMAGTPLMRDRQEIGLDLPQEFLVWTDRGGSVNITYNDPFFIAKRHGIQDLEVLLGNISTALGELAAAGAEP